VNAKNNAAVNDIQNADMAENIYENPATESANKNPNMRDKKRAAVCQSEYCTDMTGNKHEPVIDNQNRKVNSH